MRKNWKRAYLDGTEPEDFSDPSAAFTESFDGFVIKDDVLKAYKGYSDKIVIPERVTEIADNVFLFPVESIFMPNKGIKVGQGFPWNKVL
ncbi:MAG: hypothetical protein MJ184_11260 [Treponema sp.]|uniref:hypothetical protein n=1 Tax=Treponema sp. TaxID=166 RepID=UPI00298DEC2B|nr:hypothetical protein [Treponema sp.]MCQ2601926.1 hypothetical protein [Treponema sp.]